MIASMLKQWLAKQFMGNVDYDAPICNFLESLHAPEWLIDRAGDVELFFINHWADFAERVWMQL